jgi:hypothetical protein
MREARPVSPQVVPMEAAPMLRFWPLLCNLLSDPRVIL